MHIIRIAMIDMNIYTSEIKKYSYILLVKSKYYTFSLVFLKLYEFVFYKIKNEKIFLHWFTIQSSKIYTVATQNFQNHHHYILWHN